MEFPDWAKIKWRDFTGDLNGGKKNSKWDNSSYKSSKTERTSLLEKKKKMYRIMYQWIPSLTITPAPSKFHRIQDVYMENMQKKTKLYSRFLPLRIYPDSPVHMSANMECIQICLVML